MRTAERVFVWMGGAAFVASLGFWAWWYLISLRRSRPYTGWSAIAYDAVLFAAFSVHHSAFARERAKRWLAPIPRRLLRSVYVWIASSLLTALCVLWRAVGGELYNISGLPAVLCAGLQLAGVWIIARAVARIDPLELAGIRDVDLASFGSSKSVREPLQIAGPYAWVRHPVYLGWMLLVFGAAGMTGDRLVFAVISSLYLVLAVPWEERSLIQSFGEDYARYKRQVRWRIVPYVY